MSVLAIASSLELQVLRWALLDFNSLVYRLCFILFIYLRGSSSSPLLSPSFGQLALCFFLPLVVNAPASSSLVEVGGFPPLGSVERSVVLFPSVS